MVLQYLFPGLPQTLLRLLSIDLKMRALAILPTLWTLRMFTFHRRETCIPSKRINHLSNIPMQTRNMANCSLQKSTSRHFRPMAAPLPMPTPPEDPLRASGPHSHHPHSPLPLLQLQPSHVREHGSMFLVKLSQRRHILPQLLQNKTKRSRKKSLSLPTLGGAPSFSQ